MTECTLKSLLQIEDNEYNNILHLIMESDSHIGAHLLNNGSLLFNVSLYSFYPILFRQIFDTSNKEHDIILFSRYYSGWLFILDSVFDEKGSNSIQMDLLVLSAALSAADYYLYRIISCSNTKDESVINKLRRDSDSSMKNEVDHFRYGIAYAEDEIDQYCIQKYALAKAVLYLCYVSAQEPKELAYNYIAKSHDYYAIARQIIDEIEDYSEDFKNKKFNIYANELLLRYGELVDEEIIKKQLLKKAFDNLNQAIDCVKPLPDFGWKRFLIFSKDIWEEQWKI